MLVDSHCHLDFPEFADELDAVVDRARAVGVGAMVTICTRISRLAGTLAIVDRYADVYCAVGVHPHDAALEGDVTAITIKPIWKRYKSYLNPFLFSGIGNEFLDGIFLMRWIIDF